MDMNRICLQREEPFMFVCGFGVFNIQLCSKVVFDMLVVLEASMI